MVVVVGGRCWRRRRSWLVVAEAGDGDNACLLCTRSHHSISKTGSAFGVSREAVLRVAHACHAAFVQLEQGVDLIVREESLDDEDVGVCADHHRLMAAQHRFSERVLAQLRNHMHALRSCHDNECSSVCRVCMLHTKQNEGAKKGKQKSCSIEQQSGQNDAAASSVGAVSTVAKSCSHDRSTDLGVGQKSIAGLLPEHRRCGSHGTCC
jgi:hypothetical protein